RQTLRATVSGNNSELHFGLAQLRVVAGQTHGASHGNFASPAKGEAIDAGDHWLAQVLDQVQYALAAMGVLFAADCVMLGEFPDVGAGNKRLLARPGENDDSN